VESYYPGDLLMWRMLADSGPLAPLDRAPGAVILPHHAIEDLRVGGFYRALARLVQPTTVYLISPNHFEAGTAPVLTGEDLDFPTVWGSLGLDGARIEDLIRRGVAENLDKAFTTEHGIFFHAPFIKRFFPRARIVPLIIRWGADRAALDRLVEAIRAQWKEGDLVIGSVDFSHYNYRDTADFHDRSSFASVSNFDYDRLFDREIDSPATVYIVERLMRDLGFGRGERVWHTNADDLTPEPAGNATSHQYFSYVPGAPVEVRSFTLVITGSSLLHLLRSSWPWDRSYDASRDGSAARFLRDLRGEEDRFFMGSDLYLLDPPPSTEPTYFEANGIKVALLFFEEPGALSAQTALLGRLGEAQAIVVCRFPPGTSVDAGRATGRALCEAGARVVVAQGLAGGGVETWKGSVLALSLGDFLPGPVDSRGSLLQVELRAGEPWYREIPLVIQGGFPRLERASAVGGK